MKHAIYTQEYSLICFNLIFQDNVEKLNLCPAVVFITNQEKFSLYARATVEINS